MMGSCLPHSRLTPLQRELLEELFAREQRLFLTGGGALSGYYLGHRTTEDLDLFSHPGFELADACRALADGCQALGATLASRTTHPDFRRLLVTRGAESCVVDLVIDRAPIIDPVKATFGKVRVDTLREIAANKICTVLGRSEIKDLVDLCALLRRGMDLDQACADARRKDGGAEPATLAWLVAQIAIGPEARVPGGVQVEPLLAMRDELVRRLRALAFADARRGDRSKP